MSVRVLIADDHPFVRNGLRSLLREIPDCEVIDEAQDGIDAVEKAIHDKPDVVVLDISMPRMNRTILRRSSVVLAKRAPVATSLNRS